LLERRYTCSCKPDSTCAIKDCYGANVKFRPARICLRKRDTGSTPSCRIQVWPGANFKKACRNTSLFFAPLLERRYTCSCKPDSTCAIKDCYGATVKFRPARICLRKRDTGSTPSCRIQVWPGANLKRLVEIQVFFIFIFYNFMLS